VYRVGAGIVYVVMHVKDEGSDGFNVKGIDITGDNEQNIVLVSSLHQIPNGKDEKDVVAMQARKKGAHDKVSYTGSGIHLLKNQPAQRGGAYWHNK